MNQKYDFAGWATRNDLRCSDGRTIRRDAFKDDDGKIVPLVWMHQHNSPDNVLGCALLHNNPEGVRVYGFFNDSEEGQRAKINVLHGDITGLSIYANKLKQNSNKDVLHGTIREVSLVYSGANPGAYIDFVGIAHSDEDNFTEEAYIYNGDDFVEINHGEMIDVKDPEEELEHEDKPASVESDSKGEDNKKAVEGDKEMADEKEKTVQDVIDSMSEEQKKVMYFLIGKAIEDNGGSAKEEVEHSEGEEGMKWNAFDVEESKDNELMHAEQLKTIIADAKRFGSLKESFLEHSAEYGIDNIEYLFPDAKSLNNPPDFIKRETGWVQTFMSKTHHTPFSRIKSMFADITEDQARAKGYIKGNLKKEEVFSLLKRTTTPTTVYKKQKLDRDDVIDITDFDVIAWLKTEMRWMLDEEIARAALIGDGRLSSDDDKISETNIRPIYKDDALYSVKVPVTHAAAATDAAKAKAFIVAAIKARKNYKGSGNPILFTTEDLLTEMLLLTDETGRDLYESEAKLATKLRVSQIVTVEVMENISRTGADTKTYNLAGIIVNPVDYNFGADKGGSVNMFDDFDIDYNQQKYLIETRCSGALVKPYSALVLEFVQSA